MGVSGSDKFLVKFNQMSGWMLMNKLQWNFNWNSNIFIQEIAFENVVCKMASILSRPQWVKAQNAPLELSLHVSDCVGFFAISDAPLETLPFPDQAQHSQRNLSAILIICSHVAQGLGDEFSKFCWNQTKLCCNSDRKNNARSDTLPTKTLH